MPICRSGRHFHVPELNAQQCCNFHLQDESFLKEQKSDIESAIKKGQTEISTARKEIEGFNSTLSTLRESLEVSRVQRLAVLLKGEFPQADTNRAALETDADSLKKHIDERSKELAEMISENEENKSNLLVVNGELERIKRHRALETIHQRMREIVVSWNQCVVQIHGLRREANDTGSDLNNGEYPILPAEMSNETGVTASVHTSAQLRELPGLLAFGLRVWGNYSEQDFNEPYSGIGGIDAHPKLNRSEEDLRKP